VRRASQLQKVGKRTHLLRPVKRSQAMTEQTSDGIV
jgi:hypothetical protein